MFFSIIFHGSKTYIGINLFLLELYGQVHLLFAILLIFSHGAKLEPGRGSNKTGLVEGVHSCNVISVFARQGGKFYVAEKDACAHADT